MNVVFRVDASIEMGIGHVMRCLTLADGLREEGAQCFFVCREHPGNMIDQIIDRGHQVCSLPMCQVKQQSESRRTETLRMDYAHWLGCDWQRDAQDTSDCIGLQEVDWLIVDHYAVDEQWEGCLRRKCRNIMVIDDLADRDHDCDLLLDQTYGRSSSDYESLTPAGCKILTGSKYALLRPEFAVLRQYSLQRREESKFEHLLISLGGMDKDNITGKVLQALKEIDLPENCRISVVMGAKAPWLENVKSLAKELPCPVEVRVNVVNMAQLMAESDLAIGAAGSSSWERCCLGVPTMMFVLAENQEVIASALQRAGAALNLSAVAGGYLLESIEKVLTKIFHDMNNAKKMSAAAQEITEGRGACLITDVMLARG